MRYFSGFCIESEEELFSKYIKKSDYSVCGFSYGALKAFEYVLLSKERIDFLQLFSPAFFQQKDEKFKKLQLINYKKNKEKYEKIFFENIAYPSKTDMTAYKKESSYDDLKKLLDFVWDKDKLLDLIDRGVEIEVYLGEKDKIIDALETHEFFKKYATVYFLKNCGHILITHLTH